MDASVSFRFPPFSIVRNQETAQALLRASSEREQEQVLHTPVSGQSADIPDETLLLDVAQGSREALAALFRRHARIVRGVAYKVLRDAAEADDLLQDIFLLARELAAGFDPAKGSGRFWLLQMTYRRAISRRRHLDARNFYRNLRLEDTAGELPDPRMGPRQLNDAIDNRMAVTRLEKAFATLSPDQQKTLQLFYFEGYTLREIAARLGQSLGNTRNHHYRGLDKLRREISAGKLPGKDAL